MNVKQDIEEHNFFFELLNPQSSAAGWTQVPTHPTRRERRRRRGGASHRRPAGGGAPQPAVIGHDKGFNHIYANYYL